MTKEKRWGIYKILNNINGKFYIGSSRNIDKRLNDHKNELRKNKHINPHLQSAWNKYGEENFSFEILLIINNENEKTNINLRNLETDYILNTKCYNDNIGYNIIKGGIGSLNTPCSEEKKKKISESNKGKKAWNKGMEMSKEQKHLLKEVKTIYYGKSIDVYDLNGVFIETVKSIRELSRKYKCGRNTITDCLKGKTLPKKYIFVHNGENFDITKIGNNRNLETEEHLKERQKKYRENRGKKIDVYYFNGEFIRTFNSISEIREILNVSESIVRNCINQCAFNKKYIFKNHNDKKPIILDKPINHCYGDVVYNIYLKNEIVSQFKLKNEVESFLLKNIGGKNKSRINKYLIDLKPHQNFVVNDYIIKLEPALYDGDIINELRQPTV